MEASSLNAETTVAESTTALDFAGALNGLFNVINKIKEVMQRIVAILMDLIGLKYGTDPIVK